LSCSNMVILFLSVCRPSDGNRPGRHHDAAELGAQFVGRPVSVRESGTREVA